MDKNRKRLKRHSLRFCIRLLFVKCVPWNSIF